MISKCISLLGVTFKHMLLSHCSCSRHCVDSYPVPSKLHTEPIIHLYSSWITWQIVWSLT